MFTNSIRKIEKATLFLLLFLLPTQLALHFWPSWAFVFGIRVDFLSPSIYATDILAVILFLLNLMSDGRSLLKFLTKYKFYVLTFLLFAVINTTFSTSPFESAYKWLKIAEFAFVAYYFSKQKVLEISSIIKTLLLSSAVFSLIGILQFIKGGTVGGVLYFLGERTFNLNTPGIALVVINGVSHLRAYSTFSHPNSLAGFLGIVIILVLTNGHLKRSKLKILALVVSSVCFILTFSLSAYAGILAVLFFYFISKKHKLFRPAVYIFLFLSITLSLLLPLTSSFILNRFPEISQNLSQRLDLAIISGKLISQRFFSGQGLGTFIISAPWLRQPVHNIFLLVFAETGVLGLLFFGYIIFKVMIKNPLVFIFIIITGLTDHYWLTLQQNLLLLSILCGLSFKITSWRKP